MGEMTMGELKAWLDREIKKYEEEIFKMNNIDKEVYFTGRLDELERVREVVGP